ncbi:hypothetical protein BDV29DRAFT_169045, partial [Aspergillus leporis]
MAFNWTMMFKDHHLRLILLFLAMTNLLVIVCFSHVRRSTVHESVEPPSTGLKRTP